MPETSATPGWFGSYGAPGTGTLLNSYPSPIAGSAAWPTSGTNTDLSYEAPNMNYYNDVSTIIPGAVGPVRFFPTNVGPF
jgi:hypothetical protein